MIQSRLYSIGTVGVVSIVALISCRAAIPRPLPPELVLRRAILSHLSLDSVAYEVEVTSETPEFSGSLIGSGAIHARGTSWYLNSSLNNTHRGQNSVQKLFMRTSLVSPYPGTTFVRFSEISGMLSANIPQNVRDSLDSWKFIGMGSGSIVSTSRNSGIDPLAVENIFSNVIVTNNYGIDKSSSGEYEYHLGVVTNSGFLIPLHGELFIHATSFRLQKAVWTLSNPRYSSGSSLIFAVRFSRFNSAPSLPSYEQSISRLNTDGILNTIFDSSLLPSVLLSGDTASNND